MKKTYGKYIADDGGRSIYWPTAKDASDCVARACAIATGTDYRDTFKTLCNIGADIGQLPNSEPVYEAFLERHGFVKQKPPKRNGKKFPIREWVATAPKGRIVALTREHLIAVVDNVQRDTWLDERCVNSWYHKAPCEIGPVDGCDDCAFLTEANESASVCPECYQDQVEERANDKS